MSAPITTPNLRTMQKVMDMVHDYKGYGTHPSQCRVRVFADPHNIGRLIKLAAVASESQDVAAESPNISEIDPASRMIVLITEMGVGTSVTNAAETIASEVLPMLVPYPELRGHVTFIEHWPESKGCDEHFDFLSFATYDAHGPYFARNKWKSGYSTPQWRRTTKREVEELIGGEVGE